MGHDYRAKHFSLAFLCVPCDFDDIHLKTSPYRTEHVYEALVATGALPVHGHYVALNVRLAVIFIWRSGTVFLDFGLWILDSLLGTQALRNLGTVFGD
jgi:hypothetical protein